MKKIVYSTLTFALLSVNSMAYDSTKAEELSKFYSHMTQKTCADSKFFVKALDTMKMIRENKVTLLDVRTDGEAGVIALSGKNAIHIPISELFKKENLDKLPSDKPIVVVCHSGIRATLAAIGLKRVGFKKIHVLKGGMISLATADNPKNAPMAK
jgi:rhodanese-related sulfurtransferase